jgi:biopolymer transport protein ExbD
MVQEDVVCNLIPMVDIMFLLLLFFMLSADMSQRELEDLVLPQGDQVKEQPKDKPTNEKSTTINIFHRPDKGSFSCAVNKRNGICRDNEHWLIAIRSEEFTLDTIKAKLQELADDAREPDVDPEAKVRLSALVVSIRSDKAAPFGTVNKLIEMCSGVGIYKIEIGAAQPPKGN